MLTVILEVISNHDNRRHNNFYAPASPDFKKQPRTEAGLNKAIDELLQTVSVTDWISDYRLVIYQGKYAHYKTEMKPWIIINSKGEQVSA